MAHSAVNAVVAGTTAMATEVNYFYQDEKGHIIKVLKPADVKQENKISTGVFASGSNNMGAFNQMNTNQQHFVRLQPNNYNNDTTAYVINSSQPHSGGSSSSIASIGLPQTQHQQQTHNANILEYDAESYKSDHSTVVKCEENYGKYVAQSNSNGKSKLNKPNTQSPVQRKRKPDKAGKGLRHFSCKVCEKVKEKGTTTYNEVADELVAEELKNNSFDTVNCDQKNIRRRVYDALNVLMAMQIISKDKKEIRWIGLPSNSVEQCTALEKANEESRERINQKFQQLRELLLQQITYKSLIERNKEAERQGIIPTPNSSIQLPFIIVNTHKTTKIHCSVTNDKSEYIFKFNDKFEIHDDVEVLKRMGLLNGLDKGQCLPEDIERAKALVPRKFEKYIEAYGNGRGVPCESDDEYMDDDKSPDLENEEFLDNSDID